MAEQGFAVDSLGLGVGRGLGADVVDVRILDAGGGGRPPLSSISSSRVRNIRRSPKTPGYRCD